MMWRRISVGKSVSSMTMRWIVSSRLRQVFILFIFGQEYGRNGEENEGGEGGLGCGEITKRRIPKSSRDVSWANREWFRE